LPGYGRRVFGLPDVFVAGLSLDIVGAVLVARGLLASPHELALRTASFWGGNPTTTAAQIEDRVRGLIGVGALVIGFSLQAAGYALDVLLEAPAEGNAAGLVAAAFLPGLGVTAFTIAVSPRWAHRLAVDVARYDMSARHMRELPILETLVDLANTFGHVRWPDESEIEFVHRVFGVTTALPRER
jgi:hypothetical protein